MPKRSSKKSRDYQQIARGVLDAVDPDAEPKPEEAVETLDEGKNPAAVALGRLGGKKGGKARAEKLTKEQLSEIARKGTLVEEEKRRLGAGRRIARP